MTPETVTGLVLSSANIGETDRRIVLLTREKGKISAFARGAVKPKNPLVSATQAFTFGEFFVYAGRNSYTVTGAEVKNHFPGLVKDIEKYYYAAYLCEIADHYTRENLNAEHELLLLYQSLRALENGVVPNELVRYIYEWRMLYINGEYPVTDRCVRCGRTTRSGSSREGEYNDEEIRFVGLDTKKHGLVCERCGSGGNNTISSDAQIMTDYIPLRSGTIYTLRYIMTSPIKTLYSFTLKDDIFKELGSITKEYLEKTQNYDFNSLKCIPDLS